MSRSSFNTRLQKRILNSIEEGSLSLRPRKSRELAKYEREYYREFLTDIKFSSRSSLNAAILNSNIVYCGDFHSFQQSQKTAVRILSGIMNKRQKRRICIALECVTTDAQESIDAFLNGSMTLENLRDAMQFDENWAFPWEQYRPLFQFAKENGVDILGINKPSAPERVSLFERDLFSAREIANYHLAHPKCLIFVFYGDLHVARKHLPQTTKEILRSNQKDAKQMIIFQNEPSVYWKLAESQKAHKVEVIKLRANTWCIINSAPWVRLQAHLDWLEREDANSDLFDSDDYEEFEEYDEETELNLALESDFPRKLDLLIKHILSAVQKEDIQNIRPDVISFERIDKLVALCKNPSTPLFESKTLRVSIFLSQPLYLAERNIAYIPSYSLSALSEISIQVIRRHFIPDELSYYSPEQELCRLILHHARNYFASKIINPKRRCEEIIDIEHFLATTRGKKLRTSARFTKNSFSWSLRVFRWVDGSRKSLYFPKYATNNFALGIATARTVGKIIGERLFFAWQSNIFLLKDAEFFLIAQTPNEKTARTYLKSLPKFWKKAGYKQKPKPEYL